MSTEFAVSSESLVSLGFSNREGLFTNQNEFNSFCRALIEDRGPIEVTASAGQTRFNALMDEILAKKDHTISTSWGGVVISLNSHPRVEKYLVVKAGRYLAFEKHEAKQEWLEIDSGEGVLLHRELDSSEVQAKALRPGLSFYLQPGEEHCIIAFSDLLILEKSNDFKGMDKDLIFIFEPDAPELAKT